MCIKFCKYKKLFVTFKCLLQTFLQKKINYNKDDSIFCLFFDDFVWMCQFKNYYDNIYQPDFSLLFSSHHYSNIFS